MPLKVKLTIQVRILSEMTSADFIIYPKVNDMRQVAGGLGQINPELTVKDIMRCHDADFPTRD